VALPDYRSIFKDRLAPFLRKEQRTLRQVMPNDRVHLAEDRAFYYLNRVYSNYGGENTRISLAFQREVINNIVPRVRPDLIHCNDWMTGLIPAMAREMGIPCLFTIHNIHTVKSTLAHIEDRGIDAAYFWHHLFFTNYADEYETVRENIPVDFLVSGVFAAHFVNTVSKRFLDEIVQNRHDFVELHLRQELANKANAGCATGILNAPDPAFNPQEDSHLSGRPRSGESQKQACSSKDVGSDSDPQCTRLLLAVALGPHPERLPAVGGYLLPCDIQILGTKPASHFRSRRRLSAGVP
jgi:starch synthase